MRHLKVVWFMGTGFLNSFVLLRDEDENLHVAKADLFKTLPKYGDNVIVIGSSWNKDGFKAEYVFLLEEPKAIHIRDGLPINEIDVNCQKKFMEIFGNRWMFGDVLS